MLTIYNSLSGTKEEFHPIEPGRVSMYVCGMTVYDYCHMGHARVMVVFDMIARFLRSRGYVVNYVRNITDIDDKIIKRAAENGEPMTALTERFIQAMHEDSAVLGVLPPDHEPRATGHIPQICGLIEKLLANKLAYVADNKDVFFDVSRFAGYGKLSGKQIDDLRAGARVEIQEAKDDPLDFVLWKAAKPGEPSWDSPWGPGRPGWHIECSAMSTHCLGEHFDIHGGGMDLQFPHHENEIAQSEGATGKKFVNIWIHNGFVRVDAEKMSKSLGNFFTIRQVLEKKYDPEVVRFFILRAHYRSPLNYSDAHLNDAKSALNRLYTALRNFKPEFIESDLNTEVAVKKFMEAMEDDFNTPVALSVLFDIAGDINRLENKAEAERRCGLLKHLGGILGLLQRDPVAFLQGFRGELTPPPPSVSATAIELDIDAFIAERTAAKKAKNYTKADQIRALLLEHGIILEDSATGTTWRRQ